MRVLDGWSTNSYCPSKFVYIAKYSPESEKVKKCAAKESTLCTRLDPPLRRVYLVGVAAWVLGASTETINSTYVFVVHFI